MVNATRLRAITTLGTAMAVWLCAHAAAGQSLGEVAKREAERRKTVTGSQVKVYTNDSLHPVPAPEPTATAAQPSDPASGQAPGAVAGAGATPPAGDQAQAEKDPKTDQDYWRKKMNDLRGQRDRNAFMMDAMQSRINALWADFTARDDPAQRAVLGNDRQRALAELERMKKDQASLEKQIADLEEEARRANIPPGWIR